MFIDLISELPSDNIVHQVTALLQRYEKSLTLRHTQAVAAKALDIAKQYDHDVLAVEVASYLHDISALIPRDQYIGLCTDYRIPVLSVEHQLPMLLHQKVSGILAQHVFHIDDPIILHAISYHTTLHANPSPIDMIVFIADKLAWDQPGLPPYQQVVESALTTSLESACLTFIDYTLDHQMIHIPHPDYLAAQDGLSKCQP